MPTPWGPVQWAAWQVLQRSAATSGSIDRGSIGFVILILTLSLLTSLFMGLDLLYRDGRDLNGRRLSDRRPRLEDVVAVRLVTGAPTGQRSTRR